MVKGCTDEDRARIRVENAAGAEGAGEGIEILSWVVTAGEVVEVARTVPKLVKVLRSIDAKKTLKAGSAKS